MPPRRQPSRKADKPAEQPGGNGANEPQASQTGSESVEASTAGGVSSGPSSTTTTAPAGTPSVQRLGSLSRPSIGSQSASSRGKPIAKPKFPGRRSQAARAEAEKAEADRQRAEADARARDEAAKARKDSRLRGRGDGRPRGRGRGGYMGESDRHHEEQIASGPFSSGQVVSQDGLGKRRVPAVAGRRGGEGTFFGTASVGGRQGGAMVKREPGTDKDGDITMMPPVKTEDGGYISSDEEGLDKGIQRVNVDDLRVIDLTGDDDEEPVGPQSAFQPVRLKREAHKERALGLNADGATVQEGTGSTAIADGQTSEKRKGKQKSKDVEITGESERFHGTYSSSDEQEPAIKTEPTDDDESNPILPQEPPSSPESRRKAKEKIKARTLSSSAPERPAYQTQEEIDEWERHQEDLRILHLELGNLVLPTAADKEGDAAMAGAEQQPRDKKADKVYLFQFPPVLPDLLPMRIKPDPDGAADSADLAEIEKRPNNNDAAHPLTVADNFSQPEQPKLPSGAVGKLRIHRSGKATLDWGGTSMVVGMGTDASFLQDILVASLPDQKPSTNDAVPKEPPADGVAMSMGQVKGKFVVTPDFEKMLS